MQPQPDKHRLVDRGIYGLDNDSLSGGHGLREGGYPVARQRPLICRASCQAVTMAREGPSGVLHSLHHRVLSLQNTSFGNLALVSKTGCA